LTDVMITHFMTGSLLEISRNLVAFLTIRFSVTIAWLCQARMAEGPRLGRVLSKFLLTARHSKQSAIKSNDPAVDNNW